MYIMWVVISMTEKFIYFYFLIELAFCYSGRFSVCLFLQMFEFANTLVHRYFSFHFILITYLFHTVRVTCLSLIYCVSFGLQTTKGVLLHGPPGTGKTSLAQLCVRDAGVELFYVNGPGIVSEYHGESEQELHKVFESATKAAPSVVRFFFSQSSIILPTFCLHALPLRG